MGSCAQVKSIQAALIPAINGSWAEGTRCNNNPRGTQNWLLLIPFALFFFLSVL